MRRIVTTALLTVVILGFCASLISAQESARPNIILVLADDIGFEAITANGGESYQTPHLDRLATEGMRFEHCYAQPLCTPSRVQLMTGQYNVRNYEGFGILGRSQTTFAHVLKEAGYATCIAGKWQLGEEPDSAQHFGFNHSLLWQHTRPRTDKKKRDTRYPNPNLERNGEPVNFNDGEYGPDIISDYIIEFMTAQKDKPFLVYYPMLLPHCPFVATPDSTSWDPTSQGSRSYKGDANYFADMVQYMDKTVGKIATAVDQLGMSRRTIILFIGDNGTDQPVVSKWRGQSVAGGKGLTTDAGTRVPFIAHWPETIPAGRVNADLIDLSDFFPTMLDLAGVDRPNDLPFDGLSFFPRLKGEQSPVRQWIYSWYDSRKGGPAPKISARNHQFKLYASGDLFDVSQDPLEKSPLPVGDPRYKPERTSLAAVIEHFNQFTPPMHGQSKGE